MWRHARHLPNYFSIRTRTGKVHKHGLSSDSCKGAQKLEKPWKHPANETHGNVTLETGVRVYRPLTGNNSNTILKHTRTLMTRMALDDELRNIVGQGHKANFDRIDMELQEHIERKDTAKHMLVRNLKLTAGILATQDRIANGQGADRKCPC